MSLTLGSDVKRSPPDWWALGVLNSFGWHVVLTFFDASTTVLLGVKNLLVITAIVERLRMERLRALPRSG